VRVGGSGVGVVVSVGTGESVNVAVGPTGLGRAVAVNLGVLVGVCVGPAVAVAVHSGGSVGKARGVRPSGEGVKVGKGTASGCDMTCAAGGNGLKNTFGLANSTATAPIIRRVSPTTTRVSKFQTRAENFMR
jgi:hypothetical protein